MIIDPKNRILLLNNTGRGTFDTCRKKAWYAHVAGSGYGIVEKLAPSPLRIGSAVHSVLMQHYAGADEAYAIAAGLAHYREVEENPNITMTPELADAFNKETAIVEGFFPAYRAHWMIDDADWKPVASEINIDHDLGIVVSENNAGWAVRYTGKIDLIVEDAGGELIVVDHKTLSQFRDSYFDRLHFDYQVTGYAMLASMYLGRTINQVIYNCIRKSLLRLKMGESKPQFLSRIITDYAEDPGKYFKRVQCIRTDAQFCDWRNACIEAALDIINAFERGYFRRNMAVCDMYSGCPYRELCVANIDDHPNFVHRPAPDTQEGDDDNGGW